MAVVARTKPDPMKMANTIQRVIWEVDPGQPIYELSTMEQIMARAVFLPRLSTTLLATFALAALLLAALGIYGVLSYSVSQRTREIGLRMALGASGGNTVAMIVQEQRGDGRHRRRHRPDRGDAAGAVDGGHPVLASEPFDVPSFTMAAATFIDRGRPRERVAGAPDNTSRSSRCIARTIKLAGATAAARVRAPLRRLGSASGVSWSEHSTEPTRIFGRQSERRPRQALLERGDARVGGVLENAE